MATKLLVFLYLLQVLAIVAQEDPSDYPLVKDISRPEDLDNCNETECSPPCPGAIPPKHCPAHIPLCHFGCACHTDCDLGIMYCFQTEFCLQSRRFFNKRRRVTKQ